MLLYLHTQIPFSLDFLTVCVYKRPIIFTNKTPQGCISLFSIMFSLTKIKSHSPGAGGRCWESAELRAFPLRICPGLFLAIYSHLALVYVSVSFIQKQKKKQHFSLPLNTSTYIIRLFHAVVQLLDSTRGVILIAR